MTEPASLHRGQSDGSTPHLPLDLLLIIARYFFDIPDFFEDGDDEEAVDPSLEQTTEIRVGVDGRRVPFDLTIARRVETFRMFPELHAHARLAAVQTLRLPDESMYWQSGRTILGWDTGRG